MSPSDWQTIGVIFAIVIGMTGVYLAFRTDSRERGAQVAGLVAEATRPIQRELDIANATIARRDRTIENKDRLLEARNARIESLEDELRRLT